MKRLIYTLTIGIVLALTSCVNDDVWSGLEGRPSSGPGRGIQIIGAVEDFDEKDVTTRASGVSDSHISEMTMFIFKSDSTLLQGYSDRDLTQTCSSAINLKGANPTFLIDTSDNEKYGILASLGGSDESKAVYYEHKNPENADDTTWLRGCHIYIVANAWHQLESRLDEITSLATLQAALLDVDATLDMPMDAYGQPIGFPMIGTHNLKDPGTTEDVTFNINYKAVNEYSVATIPLKKLYSKIQFRMQVNSKQIVQGGQVPKFEITKAEVYNIPTKVRMGYADDDYTDVVGDDYYQFISTAKAPTPFEIHNFSKTTIYHDESTPAKDYLEFGFYMPEHKVKPTGDFGYPTNDKGDVIIPDDLKQYYKPKGVASQTAPFVRIYGNYTDHNAQIFEVEYDIYLGQNETNDFEVKRNQQLNNYLTITGITNHKDAYPDAEGNISIDHRVNVSDKGYTLSMEREAILDAHFEVRPIDIQLQKNAAMTVVIPAAYTSWIAMESDAAANDGGLYVSTADRKGVRKYFTTGLVSELYGKTGTVVEGSITTSKAANGDYYLTIKNPDSENTKYFRIWFYIDENPNVYDKTGSGKQSTETGDYTVNTTQYRTAPVKFYLDTGDGYGDEPVATITFQQWNLWRVWNQAGTRFYDIEHEEEYLNNYASDQGYGETQDGMPFGLDGIQLSHLYDAAYLNYTTSGLQALMQAIANYLDINLSYKSLVNQVFAEKSIKYDFYLPRDVANFDMPEEDKAKLTARSYAGLTFNQEIVTYLKSTYPTDDKAKLDYELNELENSAFAYVYNKNKRNADGVVETQKWYLPAIDEIEEIAKGAYDEFNGVFQDKYYWSCQPAFNPVFIDLDTSYRFIIWKDTDNTTGEYYYDNISRARATSVKTKANGTFDALVSSSSEVFRKETGYLKVPSIGTPEVGYYKATDTNPPIDYNPSYDNHPGNQLRTEVNRIRAVYRSGTGTKATTAE